MTEKMKLSKVVSNAQHVIATAETFGRWGRGAYSWYRERASYVITVNSDDRFFLTVRNWLTQQMPTDAQRHISVMTWPNQYGKTIKALYDPSDDKPYGLTLDGHKVWVSLEKPDDPLMHKIKQQMSSGSKASSLDQARLRFTTHSSAANKYLLGLFEKLKADAQKAAEAPLLKLISTYGVDSSRYLERRPLDSVVLADGQLERIVDSISNFLNSRETCLRLGIPWHFGLMLSGPPGTGKTSLARVLASHFGLDLCYFPLSGGINDEDLTNAVAHITGGAILLLEDFDVHAAAQSRESKKKGSKKVSTVSNDKSFFTLSGLLNIMDGVMTPPGLITIITSNHETTLDPALLRPGRIDLAETLGYTVGKQVDNMFEMFYKKKPASPLAIEGLEPAKVINIFKQNMADADNAEALLRELGGSNVQS